MGTAHVGDTGGILGGTSCLWALCWGGGRNCNLSPFSMRTIQVFLFRFININGVSPVLMSTHKPRAHCWGSVRAAAAAAQGW